MKSLSFFILILSVCLPGCTWLVPDYQRPAFDMPDKWPSSEAIQLAKETSIKN